MKKLALKSIMLLSLVMGVSSCVNDDVKNETTELNLSREIPVEILDTSNLFQPVELEGNFDYWLTKNNDLVFYTQTSTHLNIFTIQGVPLRKLPNSSIKSLTFLDHSLLINSNDGYSYFGVNKPEEREIFNQLPESITQHLVLEGYGYSLIHQKIPITDDYAKSFNLIEFKLANDAVAYFTGGSVRAGCGSGGAGSSSCSNSYCSVSCNAGYYACCNIPHFPDPASCICIKISQ